MTALIDLDNDRGPGPMQCLADGISSSLSEML